MEGKLPTEQETEQTSLAEPGEEPNDEIDQEYMKAILLHCMANVDAWCRTAGVQRTRKYIRHLISEHLRKRTESVLEPTDEYERELKMHLFNCLTCRRNFYTCPSATCKNYAEYDRCMRNCSP